MTDLSVSHRTVLQAVEPYSFALSQRALAGFAPCAADHQITEGRIRRALTRPSMPGRPGPAERAVVVEVESLPGSPSGVMLTVFADEPLNPTETAAIERAVSRWLSLDDDMSGFLDVAADDPAMGRLIEVARGLHQVRFASLAEGAVYFTLTQRSTQWFAAARKRRIAAELGPAVMLDGTIYRSFPSLRTLSALTDDQMVGYSGNRQRADRLRGVIEGIAALDEEWLRTAPFDEARQALLSVAGVGAFTAHALLLRVLGRPDDVPLEMAQFALTASAVYGDSPPTAGELRERYSPWVGWWAYVSRNAIDWLPESAAATA